MRKEWNFTLFLRLTTAIIFTTLAIKVQYYKCDIIRNEPKMWITQGKSHGSRATKLCLMWDIVPSRQVLPRDQRLHHLGTST